MASAVDTGGVTSDAKPGEYVDRGAEVVLAEDLVQGRLELDGVAAVRQQLGQLVVVEHPVRGRRLNQRDEGLLGNPAEPQSHRRLHGGRPLDSPGHLVREEQLAEPDPEVAVVRRHRRAAVLREELDVQVVGPGGDLPPHPVPEPADRTVAHPYLLGLRNSTKSSHTAE